MNHLLFCNCQMLMQALHDYELGKPPDLSACPYSLADIQRLADDAGFLGNYPLIFFFQLDMVPCFVTFY